jgi:hypothetical protein
LPAQQLELLARGRPVNGLGKSPLTKRERLVGAKHDPAGQLKGNGMRFFAREQRGHRTGIVRRTALLDRTLVDVRWADFDRKSCGPQDRTSNGALRRQHERSFGEPERHHSRKRLATAFGEKAHHRRRGFLDRTSRHVDARPIVPGAQFARECHFFGHCLAVDILVIVMMRL